MRGRHPRNQKKVPEAPEFAPNGPVPDVVIYDEYEPSNRPVVPLANLTPLDIAELDLSEDEIQNWHNERYPDWIGGGY